jgi:hypothetical protein
MAFDQAAYDEWLVARGLPREALAAQRAYAAQILAVAGGRSISPNDVLDAVDRARAAGADDRRVRNLEQVGRYLLEFQAATEAAAPRVAAGSRVDVPVAPDAPAPATCCPNPGARRLATVDLRLGGGVMFVLGLALVFLVGFWFAILVDLALGAATILATVILSKVRCVRCGEAIPAADLADDERRSLRTQQAIALALAAGLAAAAFWAKGNWDRERGAGGDDVEAEGAEYQEEDDTTVEGEDDEAEGAEIADD